MVSHQNYMDRFILIMQKFFKNGNFARKLWAVEFKKVQTCQSFRDRKKRDSSTAKFNDKKLNSARLKNDPTFWSLRIFQQRNFSFGCVTLLNTSYTKPTLPSNCVKQNYLPSRSQHSWLSCPETQRTQSIRLPMNWSHSQYHFPFDKSRSWSLLTSAADLQIFHLRSHS